MEKRVQLWSPVNGWFVTEEGELIDLSLQNEIILTNR